jgi:DNA polymerase-3 subunit gamma/tau
VFELDAASNNSVDDIRSLIDQVRIPPQTGKYKVYIIDEVHMLSSAAFNAFLKTLEEPPKHAIFILATTEKQNNSNYIIAMSNFDFKRITVKIKNILLKWQLVKESFLKMMLFILSLRKQMVLCAMPYLF